MVHFLYSLVLTLVSLLPYAVSLKAVELSSYNLTANMNDWEMDIAIMFYAPWCKYCKQLLPGWDSIAHLSKDSKNLVVSTFNCEADGNTEVCQSLLIDRYPSIAFLGYGKKNQAPKGGLFFSPNPHPRFVRFNADMYPEAIYDWVVMLSFTSSMQRKWDNFKGLFSGTSTTQVQLQSMQKRISELDRKVKLFGTELEKYKAIEIFDSLDNHGDPFPILSSLDPDEQNRPLRVCVGEMAGEYCKYYPEDAYCKIIKECAAQELENKACRPEKCPFDTEQGKKVVSVCMQPAIIEEYKKALSEL